MSSKEIEAQASEWLARLDAGESAQQLRQQITAWCAADPRHEVAYLRLKAGWARLDRLRVLRSAGAPDIDPDLFSPAQLPANRFRLRARPTYLAAATVLFAISSVLSVRYFTRPPVYSTDVGGFERVQLADGSVIELNTDTLVRVTLNDTQRTVELNRGEAHFTVVRDPVRPFIVLAGDTAVRAVGTAFNVRRRKQALDVIVTEGRVALESAKVLRGRDLPPLPSAPVVPAGHGVSVTQGEVKVRELPAAETHKELAWQSGMLLFEGDPLSKVADEFNRYNRRKLMVVDVDLAPLKIGGYFKATNLDVFVRVLERDFGVQAALEGNRIALRSGTDGK